jgi:hypothetical protein
MRTVFPNKVLLIAIVILVLCMPIMTGCSSGDDETTNQDGTTNDLNAATTEEASPRVGFEILEIQSPNSI